MVGFSVLNVPFMDTFHGIFICINSLLPGVAYLYPLLSGGIDKQHRAVMA